MNKKLVTLVGVTCLFLAQSASATTINSFVTGSDLNAAISESDATGFTYAGNKFVGSTYYNNQLYQTDLSGGNVQKFGAPLPYASFLTTENYVSSSLGLGGFGSSRDIFVGTEYFGTVWKYANSATTTTAATEFVTGLDGGVRSIAFDPYGKYGYDMIVATETGNVYRVNSSGTATLLANLGVDSEGLSFTPQDFGPIAAGTLVVLSEKGALDVYDPSYAKGSVHAIAPDGTKTDLGLEFILPEMISFVPLDFKSTNDPVAGFYEARYSDKVNIDTPVSGSSPGVVKAAASEFYDYIGQAIITEELSADIYAVSWDGSQFVKTKIGNLGGQAEDGIFVTAALINPGSVPEPGTIALLGLGLLGISIGRRRVM